MSCYFQTTPDATLRKGGWGGHLFPPHRLQGYTKIVDSRKREAYRRYQDYLAERTKEG
jgi:hypothetical protein